VTSSLALFYRGQRESQRRDFTWQQTRIQTTAWRSATRTKKTSAGAHLPSKGGCEDAKATGLGRRRPRLSRTHLSAGIRRDSNSEDSFLEGGRACTRGLQHHAGFTRETPMRIGGTGFAKRSDSPDEADAARTVRPSDRPPDAYRGNYGITDLRVFNMLYKTTAAQNSRPLVCLLRDDSTSNRRSPLIPRLITFT